MSVGRTASDLPHAFEFAAHAGASLPLAANPLMRRQDASTRDIYLHGLDVDVTETGSDASPPRSTTAARGGLYEGSSAAASDADDALHVVPVQLQKHHVRGTRRHTGSTHATQSAAFPSRTHSFSGGDSDSVEGMLITDGPIAVPIAVTTSAGAGAARTASGGGGGGSGHARELPVSIVMTSHITRVRGGTRSGSEATDQSYAGSHGRSPTEQATPLELTEDQVLTPHHHLQLHHHRRQHHHHHGSAPAYKISVLPGAAVLKE